MDSASSGSDSDVMLYFHGRASPTDFAAAVAAALFIALALDQKKAQLHQKSPHVSEESLLFLI